MAEAPGIREFEVMRVRSADAARTETDAIAVERALEFRVDGKPGAVTMRTPGDDEELLLGFLYSEGIICERADVLGFDRLGEDVIDVRLRNALVRKRLPERSTFASSSCGVCGKVGLEALRVDAAVIEGSVRVDRDVVRALPGRLRGAQSAFDRTGGLHAAGVFAITGELAVVREDVGRHNAVDKVIGWALAAGALPAAERVLCVSGRLSFEIVQKAAVAGFPVVAAVSAPSSLAIETAAQHGLTLCGFVRGDAFNVYTRPERVC